LHFLFAEGKATGACRAEKLMRGFKEDIAESYSVIEIMEAQITTSRHLGALVRLSCCLIAKNL